MSEPLTHHLRSAARRLSIWFHSLTPFSQRMLVVEFCLLSSVGLVGVIGLERQDFLANVLGPWWVWTLLLIWTVFSGATTVRDNFLKAKYRRRWSTLRMIPRVRWYGWVIGVLVIVLLAATEGAFRAWRSEHREVVAARKELHDKLLEWVKSTEGWTPQLQGTIDLVTFGQDPTGEVVIVLTTSIRNFGAPSNAENWKLVIQPRNSPPVEAKHLVVIRRDKPYAMTLRDGKTLEYYAEDALYSKTMDRPLTYGLTVRGVLIFRVDKKVPFQTIAQVGTNLSLGFTDFAMSPYKTDFLIAGPLELEQADGTPPSVYLPGMRPPQ
jgi:hypothetical protein